MRWSWLIWAALPAFAVFELMMSWHLSAGGPSRDELDRAAEVIRERYREGDLVVIAPRWLRQARVALGHRLLPLADQARPDEATYSRLWELSSAGHRAPEAEGLEAELERAFGEVTVRRYRLTPRAVDLHDFVARWAEARITAIEPEGAPSPCRRRGGRAQCGRPGRDEWVGTETISDLGHRPRRCLWAHPLTDGRRLRIDFTGVPRGEVIEGHTATDYVVGRRCSESPTDLTVLVDGEVVAQIRHHDCDGWSPFRAPLPAGEGPVRVTFEVTAPEPERRHFCFQAQMRRPR